MSYLPKGKHVRINPENPTALGICDYTGFIFNRDDLVRQMEWRGNALVWTGYYVGRPYADIPNPQLKPPILPPDPVPVKDPRPPHYSDQTWGQIAYPEWQYQSETWNQWGEPELNTMALPVAQRSAELNNLYWGAG